MTYRKCCRQHLKSTEIQTDIWFRQRWKSMETQPLVCKRANKFQGKRARQENSNTCQLYKSWTRMHTIPPLQVFQVLHILQVSVLGVRLKCNVKILGGFILELESWKGLSRLSSPTAFCKKHEYLLYSISKSPLHSHQHLRKTSTWQTFSLRAAPPPRSPWIFFDEGTPWSFSDPSSTVSLGLSVVAWGVSSPFKEIHQYFGELNPLFSPHLPMDCC